MALVTHTWNFTMPVRGEGNSTVNQRHLSMTFPVEVTVEEVRGKFDVNAGDTCIFQWSDNGARVGSGTIDGGAFKAIEGTSIITVGHEFVVEFDMNDVAHGIIIEVDITWP